MFCPYCDETVTNSEIESNDGCCPYCGTQLDHVSLDEDEEFDLHEDDAEDYEERFGHPTRSYEQRDVFDDFLEEEERLANRSDDNE